MTTLPWHRTGVASEIKVEIQMAVTDKHTGWVPEWLHFHVLPFYAGKPHSYDHLHGQEEQVVNVFQGCGERGPHC